VNSNLAKGIFTTEQWLLRDQKGKLVASSSMGFDTLKTPVAGNLTFAYKATDFFGCESIYQKEVAVSEKFVNPVLILPIIPVRICEDEDMMIQTIAKTSSDNLTASWTLGKDTIGTEMTLKTKATLEMNSKPMSIEVTRLKDKLSCTYSRDVDIHVNALPKITNWEEQKACYASGYIDLNKEVQPKGGIWFNSQGLINSADRFSTDHWPITEKGGTYAVSYSITNPSSGCTGVKVSKIIIEPLPEAIVDDVTICRLSGQYQLSNSLINKSSDLTYTWKSKDGIVAISDGENVDLATMPPGKYFFYCDVESETGCKGTSSFTITILNTAKIEFKTLGSICRSDEGVDLYKLLDVSPIGGTWFDNNLQEEIVDGKIPNDFCGLLDVNYTYDQEGCYDSKNTSLDVICKPKMEITTPGKICKNIVEFVPTATPVGGIWSGTSIRNGKVIIPQSESSFTLTYRYNHNGCSFEESKIIELEDAPEMHIVGLPDVICEGENITVAAPEGNTDNWSLERGSEIWNGTVLVPSKSEIGNGSITLRLKAFGNGLCNTFEETYEIDINPSPRIDLTEIQKGCEPYSLNFKPTFINPKIDPTKVTVDWNFNDPYSSKNRSQSTPAKHNYSTSGKYTLGINLVTDKGCVFKANAINFVEVHEKPEASFTSTPNEFLSIHDPVMKFFNTSKCADSMRYIWDFGSNSAFNKSYKNDPAFEFPKDTGSFTITLTVISANQCISSYSKDIYINPDIRLFVPTGFTPNGKGPAESEVFSVSGVNVKTFSIVVWNRWGQIVYQSNDINEIWDGRFRNKFCQTGAFGYKILASSQSDQDYIFTGVINLLR
jgi:gliding motility-associated-like protein